MEQPKKSLSNGLTAADNKILIDELTKYANEGASDDDLKAFRDTFISTKKKSTASKPVSESTSPKKESVSATNIGTSDIIETYRPLDPSIPTQAKTQPKQTPAKQPSSATRYPEGSMAWTHEKLKSDPAYTQLYNRYTEATTVPGERISEIRQEVEDEVNNVGFLNNLRTGAAKLTSMMPSWLGGTSGKDIDPLYKEKEQAKKELQKEQALAKANKQPVPEITGEAISEKAKQIAIDKRVKSEKNTLINSFLKEQEDTQGIGPGSNRQNLALFEAGRQSTLKENDKILLKKQNILRPAIDNQALKLKEIVAEAKQYAERGEQVPEEIKAQFEQEQSTYQNLIKDAIDTHEEYVNNTEELGASIENLDNFKRDYSWGKNFIGNLEATTRDLAAGVSGAVDYLASNTPSMPGSQQLSLLAREDAKKTKKSAEDVRSRIMKPINVEDINSMEDFGHWLSNTVVAQQVPIYAMIATGAPGVAAMGVASTGQKYEEMLGEIEAGTADYSQAQLAAIPLAFGATETASAMVDRFLLKNASRTLRSATEPERQLIAKGFWDNLKEGAKKIGGETVKGGVIEGADEAGTQIAQNLIDKYAGDKEDVQIFDNVKDAAAAGAVLGAFIPFGSNVVSAAVKPFSTDNQIQNTSAEIMRLQRELDNPELTEASRKIISGQLNKTEAKLETQLKKSVKNIESLSDDQFQEVIKLEKQQSRLQSQAREINSDPAIDERTKEMLIDNLHTDFVNNNQARLDILQAPSEAKVIEKSVEPKVEADEKLQEPDNASDADLRPTSGEVAEVSTEPATDVVSEDTQPAVDTGTVTEEVRPKQYRTGTGDNARNYTAELVNGRLEIKDEQGKEPSKPTRRKIEEQYANEFDFTAGEVAPRVEDANLNPAEHIANTSNSPVEVAEALLSIENEDVLNNVDYKTRVIAENIGKVNRQSYIDFSDVNNINNNLAKSYLSNTGAPIDTLAQELSEDYGVEITPQDVVDFINENQSGPQSLIKKRKRKERKPLQRRFSEITGLPANDKYLQKAIEQSAENDNFINNFATQANFMSDEQLVNLDNELRQYEQEINTQPGTEEIATIEDSQSSPEQSADREVSDQEDSGNEEPVLDDFDREVALQGVGTRANQRSLSLEDPVRDLERVQRKTRRFWNRTFRSNAGLNPRIAETVRSKNRDVAAFTDALNNESNLYKKLLDQVKKSDPKKANERFLAINDYMSGIDTDVSFLTTEQKQNLDYFRSRIDLLSTTISAKLEGNLAKMNERLANAKNALAKSSISTAIENTEKLIETIEANKTKYINRAYQIFVDDNYSNILSQDKKSINKEGRQKIDNAVNFLVREEGYTKAEAEEYIAEYLDAIKRSKNSITFVSKSEGKANAPFLKKRKDLPKEFRELLGESKDPIYNYVNTVYKLSSYVSNLEYQSKLRSVLEDTGMGQTNPQQGYTKLTGDSESWGVLADVYVLNEVKEAMDDMAPLERVNSGFYKAWIKLSAFTKVGKTLVSPTTIARNVISGVFLGANSGHFFMTNPKFMAEAWNHAWDTKKSQKQLANERQKLLKLGVLSDGGNAGELMAVINDFSKETERMVKKSAFQWSVNTLQKIYAFGDDFYKISGFYIEKKRLQDSGLSEAEAEVMAADRINNGYPTYSYLPKNMQHLRRFPLVGTFISFPFEIVRTTKNNMGFIKEDILAGRKKLAAQRAVGMLVANAWLLGLSTYSAMLVGIDDEDDDAIRDMLPKWQENSQLIYLGTKNGKPVFIDGTALSPSEVIMKPMNILFETRSGREMDDKISSAVDEFLTPYIGLDISSKTIIELITNQDQYGNQIYANKDLSSAIKDSDAIVNHYLKQAGPGVYNNISELMRANEIAPEVFGDKFSGFGKEYTNEEALLGLFGFRLSTINYNNGITSYGYEVKDAFTFEKDQVFDKFKTSKKMSDEEIKLLAKEYEKVNDEAYQKLENVIDGGKKLGMSVQDISGALQRAKYSKANSKSLAKGEKPPLKPVSEQSADNYRGKISASYDAEQSVKLQKIYNYNIARFEKEIKKINLEEKKKQQAKEKVRGDN